jgi:hypothetical protein
MRERPLAGDIEKRAGMFTVLPKLHKPTSLSHLSKSVRLSASCCQFSDDRDESMSVSSRPWFSFKISDSAAIDFAYPRFVDIHRGW